MNLFGHDEKNGYESTQIRDIQNQYSIRDKSRIRISMATNNEYTNKTHEFM